MVTHTYPRFPGDVTAPFVASIAEAVAAHGHEVDVLLPYTGDLTPTVGNGLRVVPFRYAPTDRLSVWGYGGALDSYGKVRLSMYALTPAAAYALRRSARRLLAERAYGVVHTHWAVPNAVLLAGVPDRVPTVISLHGSDLALAERSRIVGRLAERALRGASVVTAPSEDLAARAIALGASAAAVRTIQWGVDVDRFSPEIGALRRREVRARLGADDETLLVVGVGRLVEVKGFEYLVKAAARVDGVRVAIVGDGALRRELERLIRNVASPAVLTGPLDPSAVAEVLAAGDIVVVPSVRDRMGRVDGLPNTLLEGLASGRAVVASAVGGIPDIVESGMNGILVPPRDATALAEALEQLAADPALRARLGEAARETAVEGLTWEAVARRLTDAYNKAATVGGRSS